MTCDVTCEVVTRGAYLHGLAPDVLCRVVLRCLASIPQAPSQLKPGQLAKRKHQITDVLHSVPCKSTCTRSTAPAMPPHLSSCIRTDPSMRKQNHQCVPSRVRLVACCEKKLVVSNVPAYCDAAVPLPFHRPRPTSSNTSTKRQRGANRKLRSTQGMGGEQGRPCAPIAHPPFREWNLLSVCAGVSTAPPHHQTGSNRTWLGANAA
jgi:hypothetical protein